MVGAEYLRQTPGVTTLLGSESFHSPVLMRRNNGYGNLFLMAWRSWIPGSRPELRWLSVLRYAEEEEETGPESHATSVAAMAPKPSAAENKYTEKLWTSSQWIAQ